MNKEDNYLVVKENNFIQKASYNLTAEQQKFLCYIISKIKPSDKDFERYTVSALDFAEIAGSDKKSAYSEFKRMMQAFHESAHWIKIGDETMLFEVFITPKYNDKQGSVSVILNPDLKKYLLELSHNYTMYELWNIMSLRSKYSIRLYELFKSYSYQKSVLFDYEELKSLLCAEHYTLYAKFKERVIDVAMNEINKYTNLTVSYTVEKTGKSHRVTRVQFDICPKKAFEAYQAYLETKRKINRKNGQVDGQISIFDEGLENNFLRVSEE